MSNSLRPHVQCSTPGLPVHHQIPEFTQTHAHQVGGAIQPSHPLSSTGVQPQQDPGVPSGWTALAKREREKEWHRVTNLRWARPVTLFSEGAFIPWVVHWAKWKMQIQLNIPSVLTFIDTRFLPAYRFINKGLFFVHYLLARRPVTFYDPFLTKVGQLKHLLSLEMFFS